MQLERTLSRHLQGKQKVCRRIFSSSNLKFKAIHSSEAQKYFFFLTHRAAPNTHSFHQIRKKKIGLHFNFDLPKWTLSQSGVLSRKGSYFETWCPANLWGCQTDCYMPSCLNPLLKNAWHVLLPPLYSP